MTAGHQRDEYLVDGLALADDGLAQFVGDALVTLGELRGGLFVVGNSVSWHINVSWRNR